MNIKLYQRVMAFSFLVFASLLGYIVIYQYPESGLYSKVAVFIAAFMVTFSVVCYLLTLLSRKSIGIETMHIRLKNITRQAVLAGIYVISIMFFGTMRLLTWWDALLLAFSLILFELYFKTNKRRID